MSEQATNGNTPDGNGELGKEIDKPAVAPQGVIPPHDAPAVTPQGVIPPHDGPVITPQGVIPPHDKPKA